MQIPRLRHIQVALRPARQHLVELVLSQEEERVPVNCARRDNCTDYEDQAGDEGDRAAQAAVLLVADVLSVVLRWLRSRVGTLYFVVITGHLLALCLLFFDPFVPRLPEPWLVALPVDDRRPDLLAPVKLNFRRHLSVCYIPGR